MYKRGVCLVVLLIYEIILFNSTLGSRTMPSQVDISPLYSLELKKNINIKEVMRFMQEEHSDDIIISEIKNKGDKKNGQSDITVMYHLKDVSSPLKLASIYDFTSEALAKGTFNSERPTLVTEDIEVWRGKTNKITTGFPFTLNKYSVETVIRIQNVVIKIFEQNDTNELHGRFISTNIKWLCDAIEKSQEE